MRERRVRPPHASSNWQRLELFGALSNNRGALRKVIAALNNISRPGPIVLARLRR